MKYFIDANTKEFSGKLAVTVVEISTEIYDLDDPRTENRNFTIFDPASPDGLKVSRFILNNLHRLPRAFVSRHLRPKRR